MLQEFASQSDGIHLTLAYMALKDPLYAAWYRARSEEGDTIILDNNAYENREPAPTSELIEAAKRVGATTVVAPDYPGQDWHKTWDAFRRFTNELPAQYKILGIPQSKSGDVEGWSNCWQLMLESGMGGEARGRLSHLGMSILAAPCAFHELTGTDDIELNRLAATVHLRQHSLGKYLYEGHNIKVHYFGFGERMDVLPCYKGFGDSMDTKGPIKSALNGMSEMSGRMPRGSSVKLDMSKDYTNLDGHTRAKIQRNIDNLKRWMQ